MNKYVRIPRSFEDTVLTRHLQTENTTNNLSGFRVTWPKYERVPLGTRRRSAVMTTSCSIVGKTTPLIRNVRLRDSAWKCHNRLLGCGATSLGNCLHLQIKAPRSVETSVTKWHIASQKTNSQKHRCENLQIITLWNTKQDDQSLRLSTQNGSETQRSPVSILYRYSPSVVNCRSRNYITKTSIKFQAET